MTPRKKTGLGKMIVVGLAIIGGALLGWQLGYIHPEPGGTATGISTDQPQTSSPAPQPPPVQAEVKPEPADNQPADKTKRSWGYTVRTNQPPVVSAETVKMLSKYGGLYWVDTKEKKIALTFDLGYENGQTEKIVNILTKQKVPATFFATGAWLNDPKNVKLAQRMVSEGITIGNHTVNHPSLPTLTPDKMKQEVAGVDEKLAAAGLPRTQYLRPPMGEYSEETLKTLKAEGYTTVFWSVALRDWLALEGGSREYQETVMKRVHPGAIVLMHAVSPDLLPVLEQIIIDLRAQGYQLVGLSQLQS